MSTRKRKTPEERFKTVAVKRANRAIEALRLLSHCASSKYYTYRKEDADAIIHRIDEAVSGVKNSFGQKTFEKVKL